MNIDDITKEIKNSIQKDNPWINSKYEWIKALVPKSKGTVGELYVKKILRKMGYTVEKTQGSDSDWLINGVKCEVKLSSVSITKRKTMADQEKYTFWQIRQFQDYKTLIFICIHPNEIIIYKKDKDDFMNYLKSTGEKGFIWAGGEKKKKSCHYNIKENDNFHWNPDSNILSDNFERIY